MSKSVDCTVVSGAVGGLGTAIVERLVGEGHWIVACDRRAGEAAAWCERFPKESRERVRFYALDLSVEGQVTAFGERVRADGFHCTRLVNNAGIQGQTPISKLDSKTWDRVLRVNLYGSAWMTREFSQGMIERGFGRIVNLASLYAYQPGNDQAPYAAAKAGIVGLTHATAIDLARHGITANVIAPGLIFHEGIRPLFGPLDLDSMAEKIPVGRPGRPEEIAATVGFLLSKEASYITGQTIHVNGGLYMPG